MTLVVLAFVVVAVAIYFGYKYFKPQTQTVVQSAQSTGSAFGKLAEAEGKLVALKIATEAKKLEAQAAHVALDDVNKLLG